MGSPLRACAAFAVLCALWPAASEARAIKIQTTSNRADLISAGNALVRITLPGRATRLRVRVGRRNVTRAFARRPDGRIAGLVRGLKVGRSTIVATARGARGARLRIVNHPNGGPVFSGPQLGPWRCQKTAVDAQCNEPATYRYLYRSTDSDKTDLQPYDPASPPGDVATTTTDQGVTVPFVVRQELGYQDRDRYTVLTLYTPGEPWSRWAPQKQWNHKVLVPGGGGCGLDYRPEDPPLEDFSGTIPAGPAHVSSYIDALGRGFAVMSAALANTGHNCNIALEAEALIMLKERLIERYGDVRYTIGTGCSGGSIVQQTVANAYPRAVYDGLIITCAYPDTLTAGAQFADYHLLRPYFENSENWGPGVVWPVPQWGLVYGRPDPLNAYVADEELFKGATNPVGDCVPDEHAYRPDTNPGGVRCSILDWMINVLGPRPQSVWSEMERRAGKGFAGQPFGNAGIQYGLRALEQGTITPSQFADLNAAVGGGDIDLRPTPERIAGDEGAVANAYRSGAINDLNNLSEVAIVHHAGPDPGIAHDYAHSWWIRDRLTRSQGHHDNHVLWFGAAPLVGSLDWPTEALIEIDRWLAAVEADRDKIPRAVKIVRDRPDDLQDRCAADFCKSQAATRYGTPREVAGGDAYNDIVKCQLKPLRREDYTVSFSDADWARLVKAFPTGVCDWSKPGVGQQPTIPWLTYQDQRGEVIYGGRPMGPPPRSKPLR